MMASRETTRYPRQPVNIDVYCVLVLSQCTVHTPSKTNMSRGRLPHREPACMHAWGEPGKKPNRRD